MGTKEQRKDRGGVRPLLVTADPEVLDDVLRLAVAAGSEMEVYAEAAPAREGWSRAPLILVGADAALSCARAGLPRRGDVVLVGSDLDGAGVWQDAVALGAQEVACLPDAEAHLVTLLADATETDGRRGALVGIQGGRGGAGASVLAAGLAVTGARRGLRSLLIDADPLGGGLDLLLGGEDAGGLRWPDLAGSRGRVSGAALATALPRVQEVSVLSWDRGEEMTVPEEAMRAVLGAALRGHDLTVVDLPRHLDSVGNAVLDTASVVLLIVPAEVRAAAAAARVATAATQHCADIRVVVRGPAPAGLTARSVGDALGLPLVGWLRPEPDLAAVLERGESPVRRDRGPLAQFCHTVLAELGDVAG